MAEFDSIRSSTRSDSYVNVDSGLRAHMNKVYGLMAVAMIITGAVAWSIGTSPQLVSALFSNSIISKNANFVEFYNIKNGNLFSRININKILNKNSKIINAFIINNNMHLFTDGGKIIILDQNLEIQETINLKIKNINKVYNYQNKIFMSTKKGVTYIF